MVRAPRIRSTTSACSGVVSRSRRGAAGSRGGSGRGMVPEVSGCVAPGQRWPPGERSRLAGRAYSRRVQGERRWRAMIGVVKRHERTGNWVSVRAHGGPGAGRASQWPPGERDLRRLPPCPVMPQRFACSCSRLPLGRPFGSSAGTISAPSRERGLPSEKYCTLTQGCGSRYAEPPCGAVRHPLVFVRVP